MLVPLSGLGTEAEFGAARDFSQSGNGIVEVISEAHGLVEEAVGTESFVGGGIEGEDFSDEGLELASFKDLVEASVLVGGSAKDGGERKLSDRPQGSSFVAVVLLISSPSSATSRHVSGCEDFLDGTDESSLDFGGGDEENVGFVLLGIVQGRRGGEEEGSCGERDVGKGLGLDKDSRHRAVGRRLGSEFRNDTEAGNVDAGAIFFQVCEALGGCGHVLRQHFLVVHSGSSGLDSLRYALSVADDGEIGGLAKEGIRLVLESVEGVDEEEGGVTRGEVDDDALAAGEVLDEAANGEEVAETISDGVVEFSGSCGIGSDSSCC